MGVSEELARDDGDKVLHVVDVRQRKVRVDVIRKCFIAHLGERQQEWSVSVHLSDNLESKEGRVTYSRQAVSNGVDTRP